MKCVKLIFLPCDFGTCFGPVNLLANSAYVFLLTDLWVPFSLLLFLVVFYFLVLVGNFFASFVGAGIKAEIEFQFPYPVEFLCQGWEAEIFQIMFF